MLISFTIPVRTCSEANIREHWFPKSQRAKAQRRAGWAMTRKALGGMTINGKVTIALTRYGAKALDDDNLARALKSVRDGIADGLGMDDGDKRLSWSYAQESAKKGYWAVGVQIRSAR